MIPEGVSARLESLNMEAPLYFKSSDLNINLAENTKREFTKYWDGLPVDPHVENTPHARHRRHAIFVLDKKDSKLSRMPQTPYFQDLEHNCLYGGTKRTFSPIDQDFLQNFPFVENTLATFAKSLPVASNYVLIHCHFMRVLANSSGIGRPSPEGIHRDGFDYVSLHMINKVNCVGGQSIITDGRTKIISAPYMEQFFDTVVIDDRNSYHAALPFFALEQGAAYRDTLLASYQSYSV